MGATETPGEDASPVHRQQGKRRKLRSRIAVALAAVLVVGAGGAVALRSGLANADEVQASNDNARTGWDPNEPNLTPASVTSSNFGQLFKTAVDGQVYAQPIVAGSTVIIATENDKVYGLNRSTGAIEWTDNVGPFWPASALGCGDLVPNIGVTGTPVYDPSSGYAYFAAKVNDGADTAHPSWWLHAVNAQTGAERSGWPMKIQGTPSNDTTPFNPMTEMQRPGLLLMNGTVYVGFGAHCDYQPYRGYVVGVNTTTQALHMWTDEAGTTSEGAGIWQGGGGLVSDGAGRIFVSTGNGISPAVGPGTSPGNQLAESVIRLGVASDGTISTQDFFSPANANTLDTNDLDVGSGGSVALPSQFGTSTDPHLMVQVGKDGRIFLLNRDNLGGRGQGPSGGDNVLGVTGPLAGGVWGHPSAWAGDGGYVYVTGAGTYLTALHYGVTGSGTPVLSIAGTSKETFGYEAGSPVVTSDGTNDGSALVWDINTTGPTGANGQLSVYNAVPSNGVMQLLHSFPIGTASKFSQPATDNGDVYVGNRDGYVYGFGSPTSAPLTSPPVKFGDVAVGSTGNTTVTLTATTTVTVSAASAAAPFGAKPPTLPVTLTTGQTLAVPVTFSPTSPGGTSGTLALTTNLGTVNIGMSGNATKPGFTAVPSTLDFGTVAIGPGGTKQLAVDITNYGTAAETVSGSTAPASPFTASGLPASGTSVPAGGSVSVAVTYTPTTAESDSSSLTVAGPDGSAVVQLTGTAVQGVQQMTISPMKIDFGNVVLGQSSTQTFTVTNSGNLPMTITKAAPPTAPFAVPNPIPEGDSISPGDGLTVTVTFTPTALGQANGTYLITANTGQGEQAVQITGTGINPPNGVVMPSPGGGWSLNGSAQMATTNLVLTPATTYQSGSAFYGTALPSAGLHAHFTAQIGPGNGADGLTFTLANAAASTPASVGAWGGGLGFAGLNGVAVALDTFQQAGAPSNNFVGVTTQGNGDHVTYLATATNVPNLRVGTHTVDVTVTATGLSVAIDGNVVLTPNVAVPQSVFAGFTAGTGGLADAHTVSGVSITQGSTNVPPPGGGWSFNGNGTMAGTDISLTQAVNNQVSTVTYPQPVAADGLHAHFTTQIGGGNGADGLTFSLLDPSVVRTTTVGPLGYGMGVVTSPGYSVMLNTFNPATWQLQDSLSITKDNAPAGNYTYVGTARGIAPLRTGTHTVDVSVSGGVMSVGFDGVQTLSAAVQLPPAVLVSFTAGTGNLNDAHIVRNATITASSWATSMPGGSDWNYNGTATLTGANNVQLTPVKTYAAGSAFNARPVPTANLHARYTVTIGGGGANGADGLTFAMLDATKAGPQSVGVYGGGLGFSGLPGVAVTLQTWDRVAFAPANFAGIANGGNGDTVTYAVPTATVASNLRTVTHTVDVQVVNGKLVVKVDNAQVFNAAVALPQYAIVGFTGGTGGLDDAHSVSNVYITY